MYYLELTYPKSKKGDLALENVDMSLNEKYNVDPKIYANEGCGLVVGDAKLWTFQFPKLLAHFEALGLKIIHSKLDHMILVDEPIAIFILQRKESSIGVSPDEVAVQMASTTGESGDYGDYLSAKASKDSNDENYNGAGAPMSAQKTTSTGGGTMSGARSPASPSMMADAKVDGKAEKEPATDVKRLLQLLEEGTRKILESDVKFKEGFNVNIFPIDRTTNFSGFKTTVDNKMAIGSAGGASPNARTDSKDSQGVPLTFSRDTLHYQNLYQNLSQMRDPHYEVHDIPVTRKKNELKHVFKDLAGFHRDDV
jgi:hypothetical protein